MSLSFEIEKTARDLLLLYGDRLATPKGRIHASANLASALMPLIERAVREALKEGTSLGWDCCDQRMSEDDYEAKKTAIVARVMQCADT